MGAEATSMTTLRAKGLQQTPDLTATKHEVRARQRHLLGSEPSCLTVDNGSCGANVSFAKVLTSRRSYACQSTTPGSR